MYMISTLHQKHVMPDKFKCLECRLAAFGRILQEEFLSLGSRSLKEVGRKATLTFPLHKYLLSFSAGDLVLCPSARTSG